jgi:hypothetical protein
MCINFLPGNRRGRTAALLLLMALAMPRRHGADRPQAGGGSGADLGGHAGVGLRLRGGRGSSGIMIRLRSACLAVESGRADLQEVWR